MRAYRRLPLRFPGLRVIAEATAPMLSLATLRNQCEIVAIDTDSDDNAETHPDDQLLLTYLSAAVAHCEDFTGRAVALRTYEQAVDTVPAEGVRLLRPPLVELLGVVNSPESDGDVDPADYVVDNYSTPAIVRWLTTPAPAFGGQVSAANMNAFKFRFRAGYQSEEDPDSDAQPLDAAIKMAILLMVGHWYTHRDAVDDGNLAALPLGVDSLLRPKRVRLGMA